MIKRSHWLAALYSLGTNNVQINLLGMSWGKTSIALVPTLEGLMIYLRHNILGQIFENNYKGEKYELISIYPMFLVISTFATSHECEEHCYYLGEEDSDVRSFHVWDLSTYVVGLLLPHNTGSLAPGRALK